MSIGCAHGSLVVLACVDLIALFVIAKDGFLIQYASFSNMILVITITNNTISFIII